MPTFDKSSLGKTAYTLGFIRDTFEKMCRLTEILHFISSEQELNTLLALKGGTAINLTVFKLPRLSVDIDMDFTENLTRDNMLIKRARINEVLERYMANENYALRDKSKNTHTLDSMVYAYTNAAGNSDNIKIEINYSNRAHVLPLVKRSIETLGVLTPTAVLTLDPIEIFASKISALLTRAAARDLYDVNNMVLHDLWSKRQTELLRKCFVFYLALSNGDIPEVFSLDKLDALTYHDIKLRLVPMLSRKDSFELDSARERVKAYLSRLLNFSDAEKQFLSLFGESKYCPDLLFEGDMYERIKTHPMAMWKTQIRQE